MPILEEGKYTEKYKKGRTQNKRAAQVAAFAY
jgi:hypothetical protein